MKPCVYVDMDDVLCETARQLMRMINARFGRAVRYEQITTFNLEEAFDLDVRQTEVLSDLFHDPEVLMQLEPIAGAADALGRWQAAGIGIEIVTGRPPVTDDPTRGWLHKHGIPYDRLFYMDKYQRGNQAVPGTTVLTATTLRRRVYALAVDDAVPMVRFFTEQTDVPMVVFDRPWNRACDPRPRLGGVAGAHRCRSWAEIEAVAEAIPGIGGYRL